MSTCQMCEQPDDTGGYLCVVCTKATRVRLECLPELYTGLLPFLTRAGGTGQGRGSKPAHAPLPTSEDVLDLRGPGGMVGVVENWVGIVRRDRGMQQLAPVGSIEHRLKVAVDGLLANLPWISVSWPDAGAFATDIKGLTTSVSSIVRPAVDRVRGTRVGNCPAQFEDGSICGAVLRLPHGERVVTCEWCGMSYPPATWIGLKLLIDADAA